MNTNKAPMLARTVAQSGAVVGMASHALLLVLGCLIPFTAGVSAILTPLAVIGWFYALIVGWRARKTLQTGDPARRTADISFFLGVGGVVLVALTLGMLLISILTGVALSQLAPELFQPHRHH